MSQVLYLGTHQWWDCWPDLDVFDMLDQLHLHLSIYGRDGVYVSIFLPYTSLS